ncbi:MAG TPA: S8/S53 family peptidase, partial [Polyangiaceae bacterium]|nr:S8/S53 family peptidase [Polyangiaceae bacterium]
MRIASTRAGLAALLASALLAAGACGDDDDDNGDGGATPPPATEGEAELIPFDCPETPPTAGEHVVMIVDHGFDLTLPVFQGKLAGCFRRVCDEVAPAEPPADAAGAKQRFIDQINAPDNCRLESGALLRKSRSFASIAPSKDAWNAAVGAKTLTQGFPEFDTIARVLGGEDTYSYHGTWVASVIAYQNPGVKFVVVANDAIRRADAPIGCPTPAEFDAELALYNDPDVRAAYVAAPYGQSSQQVDDVVRRLGVTVVNESFGSNPWLVMNEICPGLDWQGYYATITALGDERFRGLTQAGVLDGMSVLTVAAAGNEGVTINTEADSLRCGGGQQPDGYGPASATMLVGSYEPLSGQRSDFSNDGACVDAYAPGESIVVAGPEGWLFVVSGTSFSAPMTTRFLTRAEPATTGGPGLGAALLAAREPGGNLPAAAFPSALFYRERAASVNPDFSSLASRRLA